MVEVASLNISMRAEGAKASAVAAALQSLDPAY
jgi:hypothetical protein